MGFIAWFISCISSLFFKKKKGYDFDGVAVSEHTHRHEQKFVTKEAISLRNKAGGKAVEMKKAFAESQSAYKSNRKSAAHDLSVKGKKAQTEMNSMNEAAVAVIIKGQIEDWKNGFIDLHGLYVKEAETETKKFIDYHEKKKTQTVVIITGAGHHSKTRDKPLIRPAVEKILKQKRIKHDLEHGSGSYKCFLK